jgi:hypothetical protein
MEVCKEMQKLRDWLDKNNIDWEDASEDFSKDSIDDFWICRTWFEIKGKKFSVINGYGTWGGIRLLDGKNVGLLEIMGLDDVIGYMTADEVIAAISEKFEER